MKKHKYLFVACLSLFPVMAVAGNDTLHEIMEVPCLLYTSDAADE